MRKLWSFAIPVSLIALLLLAVRLLLLEESGPVMLEPADSGAWSFHTYVGFSLSVFFVAVVISPYAKKLLSKQKRALPSLPIRDPVIRQIKWWTMIALLVSGAYIFTFCNYICTNFVSATFDPDLSFFHILYRYTLSFFPYLIAACFIGGLIMTRMNSGMYKMPDSMLGGMAFASLLPVCSCGAIPIAKAMIETKQIRIRTVIAFLMVAPVLSPVVIPLSFQLGASYAILRIVSIAVLGAVAGFLVERFAGVKGEGGKVLSCSGCSNSGRVKQTQEKSFVIASWDLLISLLRPIFIGILAGTIVAKYVPSSLISTVLSPDYVGLVVATMIALPVYLCHGQEVALLRPLMSASLLGASALPVGHAIAFTLAGTGICASAIPPLVAIVGKKATSVVLLTFFFGSILIGAAINLLLQMI
ncbi:MAG: permease [Candidatus Methanosuratincola sp.]|nr:permease [Candidatus Methanosuratincola sp.]